jgi:hypothetical protein
MVGGRLGSWINISAAVVTFCSLLVTIYLSYLSRETREP